MDGKSDQIFTDSDGAMNGQSMSNWWGILTWVIVNVINTPVTSTAARQANAKVLTMLKWKQAHSAINPILGF